MKKIILIACVLLNAIGVNAELINGPANIRLAPGKKLLLTLNDNVEVDCDALANGWFEISFDIKLTDEQYKRHIHIIKGDKLIDVNGGEIGIALTDFTDTTTYTQLYEPGMIVNDHEMTIIAFTQKSNIKPESIPEMQLSQIINESKGALGFDKFKSLITTGRFRKFGLIKKFYPFLTEYTIQETAMDSPSVLDRLRLIFDKDILIAIIHSRQLSITNVKEYNVSINKLIVFKTPQGVNLNTFVKRNKQSYNGVD